MSIRRWWILVICLSLFIVVLALPLGWQWLFSPDESALTAGRVFFNNSDWDEQYVLFVEETAGSCANFLAHQLTSAQGERFSMVLGGLQEGEYSFDPELTSAQSVWCFATSGSGREAPTALCTAGQLTLTQVTSQQLEGVYSFTLDNGQTNTLQFSAQYCPFE